MTIDFTVPPPLLLFHWSDSDVGAASKDRAELKRQHTLSREGRDSQDHLILLFWLGKPPANPAGLSVPPGITQHGAHPWLLLSLSTQGIPFVTVRAKLFPQLLFFCQDLGCNLALNYRFCQISMTEIEQLHLIKCFSANPGALPVNDASFRVLLECLWEHYRCQLGFCTWGEALTIAQQVRKEVRTNIPADKSPAVGSLIISLSEQNFGAMHIKNPMLK